MQAATFYRQRLRDCKLWKAGDKKVATCKCERNAAAVSIRAELQALEQRAQTRRLVARDGGGRK